MSKRYKLTGDGVALVTGASAGIGVALAKQLAAKGYSLLLVARRKERMEALAKEIEGAFGVSVWVLGQDLGKRGAAEKVLAFVEKNGLDIGLLVNNAGFGWDGEVVEMPQEKGAGMIDLNVMALTELCRVFGPRLVARGSGGIINVSSVAGYSPMPRFAVYAATKAYVNSFSQALAVEMAPKGVHVLCVCPGGTSTEFAQVSGREEDKASLLRMSADEVARLGLKAFDRGEFIAATGLINQAAAGAVRLMPENLLLKVMDMGMKAAGR